MSACQPPTAAVRAQQLGVIFHGLAPARLKPLLASSRMCRVCKGDSLFKEGQPATHVWLLLSGWVFLVKHPPQAQRPPVTIVTLTPEDVLCGYSAAVGRGTYFMSAVAATQTTAVRIPKAVFAALLRREPRFAGRVLDIYHARMGHMAEVIALAQTPVAQRLAHTLLRLQKTFGRVIPVTHAELARMAGTRWETSIRTISAMKRRGWLTSGRGKIMVQSPERLRQLLRNGQAAAGGEGRG